MTLTKFTSNSTTTRRHDRKQVRQPAQAGGDATASKDILDKFLDANVQDPERFNENDVSIGLTANIVAGSDTTASSLSGILYHLLKNPSALARLQAKIDKAWDSGQLSSPVTFKQSQNLVYLQAVIHEALRLHPAVGLPLFRVVPKEGAVLCGKFFPGATVVGVNPWVMHYSKSFWYGRSRNSDQSAGSTPTRRRET